MTAISYSSGQKDFSHCARKAGEGVVGKVFTSGESCQCFEYKTGDDPEMEEDMGNDRFSSML